MMLTRNANYLYIQYFWTAMIESVVADNDMLRNLFLLLIATRRTSIFNTDH